MILIPGCGYELGKRLESLCRKVNSWVTKSTYIDDIFIILFLKKIININLFMSELVFNWINQITNPHTRLTKFD